MSLYGMMRTGVSGMNAQSNRLGTVADNIANSSTAGYKRAFTEFSSLVVPNGSGSYNSGGVTTSVRYDITKNGVMNYTTSVSDLAIDGDGFFVVQNGSGGNFLTRAGSFVPDGEGRLVNAAGFYLTGYSYANGTPSATANGFAGLEVVTIKESGLTAVPSTSGEFSANLPETAEVLTPAAGVNDPDSKYTAKSSLVVYGNLGKEIMLDVYFTKTDDNTWQVAVYNKANAATGDSPFPYANPTDPADPDFANGPSPLAIHELVFNSTTGQLDLAGGDGPSMDITMPGNAPIAIDFSQMSQLDSPYAVSEAFVNGNAASAIDRIEIATDGTLSAVFQNGTKRALYQIPVATVQSPDQLAVLSGNVFSPSNDSGDVRIGFPNEGGFGKMVSGAVETSNVDIATELTSMIEAQRNYTANSKVFQTGSELLDVLVNLKR
ncbi:flagellar hook protein FlgE [Mesorhizobium sp. 1B3]|uniref:flagellar hook protein FlgE n=1 Tax=Mesorhizobium sp. 1B3 TaxID=3243599 RepID=UPI003D987D1F